MKNTIKRLLAMALAVCLTLSVLPISGSAAEVKTFTDVNTDSWFYGDIRFVCEKSLMIGTSDQTFSPNEKMSRAMLTTVLYRLAGSPVVEATAVFADVPAGLWYSDAITWASENHVVEGYGNDLFGPNDPITREQLVTMLYQYAGKTGSDITESKALDSFNDAAEVHEWALDAMQWAYAAGVVIGRSSQCLAPQASATRAEAAAMLHRFIQNSKPETDTPEDAELTVSLHNFAASESDIYLNTEVSVTFTVDVEVSRQTEKSPSVYDDRGNFIVAMNDDGIGGDACAADGIYSGQTELCASEIQIISYHAEMNGSTSNSAEISFYRDLTQEDFTSFCVLRDKIAPLTFEDACEFVMSCAEIVSYEIDAEEQTIIYRTVYGLSGMYEVEREDSGTKGRGIYAVPAAEGVNYTLAEENLLSLTVEPGQTEKDVVIVRPFRSTEFQYDDFKDCGSFVMHALDSSATAFDDDNATLAAMKSLGGYGVVLIDSHGTKCINPYILIGEELNEDRFLWDAVYYLQHVEYSADYCSGRILCTTKRNRLAVGGKFFDKYYSDDSLSESFWYLGACHSLCNDSIASALCKKGAEAIIGFDKPVSVEYCNRLLFEIVANSMILSADNVSDALEEAKSIHGESDPWQIGTHCLLYGNGQHMLVNSLSGNSGTLIGKVCKASDRLTPVPNAQIEIYRNDALITACSVADDGSYTASLMSGTYKVCVTADGYIGFTSYIVITANETTYTETFLMVEGDEQESGTATGTVFNALTGTGIEGVTLIARAGWNNTSEGSQLNLALQTDASGKYSITLPLGNYTLELTKDGYISSYINIIVQSGTTADQNGTMSPVITGDSFRIVLSWGANPSDLDSHVEGMRTNGTWFHVYYADQYAYDGDVRVCDLDVDDTNSYGPETITLNTTTEEPYYYYVHKYAGNGTLPTSEAKVRVYQGEALIAEYNVPTDLEAARYWNVFAIVNGQIVTRNTMTSAPELHYAE